jgi:cellulose biosynthesis protein BcsQ
MTLGEAVSIVTATGTVVGVIDFLIRMWLQKHHDKTIQDLTATVDSLQAKLDTAAGERDQARAELTAETAARVTAASKLVSATGESAQLGATLRQTAAELAASQQQLQSHEQAGASHASRIKAALNLKGALWTQPTMAGTPKFVELAERRTPIVSVLNLKGGVGKTTLTAYLARTLAARGYRILLVDLDLQGSLSSLFVSTFDLARLAQNGGKFLSDLLSPPPDAKAGRLIDYTIPCPLLGKHSRLLPTTDRLAYAELSQTVQWLLRVGAKSHKWNGSRDGRMILRKALHRETQYRRFDVVLMDCPPIINLCCANALAASDYVLTPITPSLKAIERVTPLLRRITEVQATVNKDLRPLGVVVNNTRRAELTNQESDLLVSLPEQCLKVYGHDVYRFDTVVPSRTAVRDAEQEFGAEMDPEVSKTFDALADEFLTRLAYCRHPSERAPKPKPAAVEEQSS